MMKRAQKDLVMTAFRVINETYINHKIPVESGNSICSQYAVEQVER